MDIYDLGINNAEFKIGECEQLLNIHEDDKRILFIMNKFHEYRINIPQYEILEKSVSAHSHWYNEANEFYKNHQQLGVLLKVCEMYSKSIAFAPLNSMQLAQAYANKSAVLLRLEKYEECVKAIDCSLKTYSSQSWMINLFSRKIECLTKFKMKDAKKCLKESLNWVEKNIEKSAQASAKTKLEQSFNRLSKEENVKKSVAIPKVVIYNLNSFPEEFKYTKPNEEIPSISDSLILQYNEDNGRHYIAKEDIKAGMVLGIESNYIKILHYNKRYTYCWACLQPIWHCVPCDRCSSVLFCTEKCKKEAWDKFHDMECAILSQWLQMNQTYVDNHVASLRMLILGIKECGSISDLKKKLKEVDEQNDLRTKGFSSEGKFLSNSYANVYGLCTNTSKRDHRRLKHFLVYTIYYLYKIAVETTFFGSQFIGNWRELGKKEDVVFIGGLLFKNVAICEANSFRIIKSAKVENEIIGLDISPCMSFLNHNCNPNAETFFKNGCRILASIYPIKKGDQISIRYTNYNAPKIVRKVILQDRYLFDCKCLACEEMWPSVNEYPVYKDAGNDDLINENLKEEFAKVKSWTSKIIDGNYKNGKDVLHVLNLLRKMLENLNNMNISMPSAAIEHAKNAMSILYDLNIVLN